MKHKIYKFLTLLFILPLLCLSCGPKPIPQESVLDSPENQYTQGLRKMEAGDLSSAEVSFRRAQSLNPKYPGAFVGLALIESEKQNYQQALDQANKAIDLDNQFIDGYVAKGRILTERKKGNNWLEQAIKEYETALKISPDNEMVRYFMGESYLAGYRFSEAESMFSKVVEQKGSNEKKADERWQTVQKIRRATPGSKYGKQIAVIKEIDRAALAVLLIEELKLPKLLEKSVKNKTGYQSPESFNKINSLLSSIPDIQNHWAKTWITDVLISNAMALFPDNQFHPDEKISRGSFSQVVQAILIAYTNDPELTTRYIGEKSRFSDLASSHWAYNSLALCVDRGIITTDLDGKISINQSVSGADALLMIRKFQNALRMEF